jgi:hypothetical protein
VGHAPKRARGQRVIKTIRNGAVRNQLTDVRRGGSVLGVRVNMLMCDRGR